MKSKTQNMQVLMVIVSLLALFFVAAAPLLPIMGGS